MKELYFVEVNLYVEKRCPQNIVKEALRKTAVKLIHRTNIKHCCLAKYEVNIKNNFHFVNNKCR